MNELLPPKAEESATRRQRTDIRTRDLVNQAIASVPTLGLPRAAEFLATMNVPAEVAVRVLVYPNRRRGG
ncbi:hypothetical protein [Massilia niastensis]|uniref:hypothetical protein n=1 Tax=Massilia niastensis TaxID=544911 RepID=UPI0003A4094B|nr:hypothetical protein [Massilia niastensis]